MASEGRREEGGGGVEGELEDWRMRLMITPGNSADIERLVQTQPACKTRVQNPAITQQPPGDICPWRKTKQD